MGPDGKPLSLEQEQKLHDQQAKQRERLRQALEAAQARPYGALDEKDEAEAHEEEGEGEEGEDGRWPEAEVEQSFHDGRRAAPSAAGKAADDLTYADMEGYLINRYGGTLEGRNQIRQIRSLLGRRPEDLAMTLKLLPADARQDVEAVIQRAEAARETVFRAFNGGGGRGKGQQKRGQEREEGGKPSSGNETLDAWQEREDAAEAAMALAPPHLGRLRQMRNEDDIEEYETAMRRGMVSNARDTPYERVEDDRYFSDLPSRPTLSLSLSPLLGAGRIGAEVRQRLDGYAAAGRHQGQARPRPAPLQQGIRRGGLC